MVCREEHLEDVVSALDYMQYNLSVPSAGGDSFGFGSVCGPHCNESEIIRVVARIFRQPDLRNSPNFKIRWPMMDLFKVSLPEDLEETSSRRD